MYLNRDNPRWRLAIHEAAHGIACLATNISLFGLEVDADNEAGRCRHCPPSADDTSFASSDLPKQYKEWQRQFGIMFPPDWVKRRLVVYLAGPWATWRLTGEFRGCGGDFADAEAYLDLLPKKQRGKLYREAEREADRIVNHEYPFPVAQIANCLYHRSPLYVEEIRALVRQCGPRGLRLLGEI